MSDVYVYDKAKYHFEDENEQPLTMTQASVHTGMFVGWLISRQLMSKEFVEESATEIERFHTRELTGTAIYLAWDGVLVDDMLSDEGNRFAMAYFDFDEGQYLDDYDELFASVESIFDVEDTWENYEKVKKLVNQRYEEWKSKK